MLHRPCLRYLPLLLIFSSALPAQVMISRAATDSLLTEFHRQVVYRHTLGYNPDTRAVIDDSLAVSRKELDRLPEDSIRLTDAWRLMARVQAATGDGHISLAPQRSAAFREAANRSVRSLPLFPLLGDTVAVRYEFAYDGDTVPAGSRLLRFNGFPAAPLVNALGYLTGRNDNNLRTAQLRSAAWNLPQRWLDFYGPSDSMRLDLVLPDGAPLTVTAPFVLEPAPAPGPKKQRAVAARKTSRWPYYGQLSEDSTYYYLRIGSFNEEHYAGKRFRRRLKSTFADLRALGTDKLLIDLRGNSGGQISKGAALLSYLIEHDWRGLDTAVSQTPAAKPPNPLVGIGYWLNGIRKEGNGDRRNRRLTKGYRPRTAARRYAGDVVVLIDEYSFSTTTLFAAWAKKHGVARLVGVTSGGNPNLMFGGFFRTEPLTVAGRTYDLRMGTYRFAADLLPENNLEPDLQVRFTLKDFETGRDAQREAAVELLLSGEAKAGDPILPVEE